MQYLRLLVIFIGTAVLNYAFPHVAASGGEEFFRQSVNPLAASAPEYRTYFHNYPHQVPADYVYRTARVFGPPPQKGLSGFNIFSWFKNLESEKQKRLLEQNLRGKALRLKVNDLARQLITNSREDYFAEYVIAVSSFVNLNDLYRTSSLGRFFSEQLISDLQQAGAEVIEVRKSPAIMIKEGAGEYGLSRDIEELSYVQDAQAMIVGTYTFVENQLFVNVRLIGNSDNKVLSSASLVFGLDEISRGMLSDEQFSPRKQIDPAAPVQVRAFVDKTINMDN